MFAVIFASLTFWTDSEPAKDEVVKSIEPVPVVETTEVVVANSDISPHTVIRNEMLQLKAIPNDLVPEGAATSIAEIANTAARTTILAGDILTRRKIYEDANQAGFVGMIPPDCRAVSINVNGITGVDGFAKPGDRVDLLLVENDNKESTSRVLLQNVLLLSINQNMSADDLIEDGSDKAKVAISNPSVATLALQPADVLTLISASKLGEIYMMLRPFNPLEMYVGDMPYTTTSSSYKRQQQEEAARAARENELKQQAALQAAPSEPPVEKTPPPVEYEPSEPSVPKIEIIQGDQIVQQSDTAEK